jgi:hypothetical protein
MTYSSGPGGYGGPPQGPQGPSAPGYGPQSQAYGAAAGQGESKGLPFYFNVGVIALGVLSFFLGFAPYISGTSAEFGGESISVSSSMNFFMTNGLLSISLLLVGALVAAFGLLPKQEIHEGVVSSLSVVGFISLLCQLISLPGEVKLGFGLILVLVLSFLQSALAIAALLFSTGVIKPPQPKQPQYGYYGAQGGGYGQPQQSQPQQPYYGGGPGPGSYQQQPPPSQPPQQHNPW